MSGKRSNRPIRVGLAFLFFFARPPRIQNLTLNTVVPDGGGWEEKVDEGKESGKRGRKKRRKRRALNVAGRGEGERKRVRREEIGDGPLGRNITVEPAE